MNTKTNNHVTLVPLQADEREQFILDNQKAFKYGISEKNHFNEEGEIISRATIEDAIDGANAKSYCILLDGENVGGAVISVKGEYGELELLFVNPDVHSKGIGYAAWCMIEQLHPEVTVWETITPYFEKRNIHFYVNRCGFHIVEFWNKYNHGFSISDDTTGNSCENDEMFVFRKTIKADR